MILLNILIFILGTIIGSFLNVVICRLKSNESIIKNRSHCVFCDKKLDWFELIPIISFIFQTGKCRKCKKKISWQYPIVELVTGGIFLLISNFSARGGPALGWQFTDIINLSFLFIISCFLIVIFVYDLKYYLIPDIIVYPAIVVTFLYQLQFSIFNYLLAGLIGGGFFLTIVLISRGKWMGVGDIKLGFLMGLFLGLNLLLVALSVSFLSGAIISVILLVLKKKQLKSEIPFGPFLIGATFISLFWGSFLSNWYFNLFL